MEALSKIHGVSILYVEDSPSIRLGVSHTLYKVFDIDSVYLAADGIDALEKYKGHKGFDIVVTDINMPNMNGIQLINKILEINNEQIIAVLSSYNDTYNGILLRELPIAAYIDKPINLLLFITTLEQLGRQVLRARED